ncbi:MAG: hypothetical protein DWH78_09285 [Planctomycetota bacterium]|nr:MAG: hypothetical protein DWH78_09285 [Planctomycetota bacterium]
MSRGGSLSNSSADESVREFEKVQPCLLVLRLTSGIIRVSKSRPETRRTCDFVINEFVGFRTTGVGSVFGAS